MGGGTSIPSWARVGAKIVCVDASDGSEDHLFPQPQAPISSLSSITGSARGHEHPRQATDGNRHGARGNALGACVGSHLMLTSFQFRLTSRFTAGHWPRSINAGRGPFNPRTAGGCGRSFRHRAGAVHSSRRSRLVQFSRNTPFGGARALSQNAPCRVSDLAPVVQVECLSSRSVANVQQPSERRFANASKVLSRGKYE